MDVHEDGAAPLTARSRLTRGLALGAVVVAGLVYFASAVVTTAPITPLTLVYGERANQFLSPYVSQNWQLFAPDPISEDRGIAAQVRCADGSQSGFVDVTTPTVEAVHRSRFFPSRMSRVVSNGIMHVFLQDPFLLRFREDVAAGDAPETLPGLDELSPQERESRERGERTLHRFAAWALVDRCDEAGEVVQVRLRYVIHRFPRWSEREQWQETGDVEVLETPWARV